MRRKKLLSIISSMLILFMLSPLTGCSKQNNGNSAKSGNAAGEVLGYPIVKDKSITLRYWLPFPAAMTPYMKSLAENEVYIEIEKVTGIKVDYMHPAGNVGEQFSLMISSGDIPDMIQEADNYKGGIVKGVEDGVYLDLTPLVQKYAPDYYNLLNTNVDVRRQNTYAGGKYYTFNRVKPEDEIPFKRLNTRQDWLDEAGMQPPKTIEEWEAYFKFLSNSKPESVPFILAKSGIEPMFLGAWNGVPGFFTKDSKKVEYGQIQPEFKEYLTLMNKWYSYGYIHKNFMNIGDAAALKDYGAGKAGVIVYSVGNAGNQTRISGFPHASAPFPRLKLGDKLHWFNADWKNTGGETAVSKSSKYQSEAMRWLNYAYTKEGAILFNYGVKENYIMVDGKPKYNFEYLAKHPKYSTDAVNSMIRLHFGPKWTFPDMECNYGVLSGGKETIDIRSRWSDDKDVDNKYLIPPLRYTAEESEKRTPIMEDINSYVNGMIIKFITGAEPISKFDEYVTQVKKLSLEEAVKLTQSAYDRYLGN